MRHLIHRLLLTALLAGTALVHAAGTDQPGFFAFGGIGFAGSTSPGEIKFRQIFLSDDPEAGFRQWFDKGGGVGKAYAMVACYYLDHDRYDGMKERFRELHLQVPTMTGCIVGSINYEQLTESIEDGRYDEVVKPLLKQTKDAPTPSTEATFALGSNERGAPLAGEIAFRQILTTPDPVAGLEEWANYGTYAQRAYAQLGLYYLDQERYQAYREALLATDIKFFAQADGLQGFVGYPELIELIEAGHFDATMRPLLNSPEAAPTSSGDKEALYPAP
ncbi:hypothetical protein [Ruficoccus sp. ZRK36]|uniref:hypothetical protein n=1 Tax=Ruficoccus sp. ZRK36 TaxID=2866311 RepID=UPI001C73B2D0|nr:hypothetical protein [Ruficoccus sp. ZRK36]QYY34781.1 hypothetical protein K0V07_10755 [Ruficoccus sp. ZRK36]